MLDSLPDIYSKDMWGRIPGVPHIVDKWEVKIKCEGNSQSG